MDKTHKIIQVIQLYIAVTAFLIQGESIEIHVIKNFSFQTVPLKFKNLHFFRYQRTVEQTLFSIHVRLGSQTVWNRRLVKAERILF